jgi:hypothetical protein
MLSHKRNEAFWVVGASKGMTDVAAVNVVFISHMEALQKGHRM